MERGLDISLKKYVNVADVLRAATTRIIGHSVPDCTYQSWRYLLAAMRLSDHQIDHFNDPSERSNFIANTTAFVTGSAEGVNTGSNTLDESLRNLRNCLQRFPEPTREQFALNAGVYARVIEGYKQTTSLSEYMFYRRLEGQVASRFLSMLLPEEIPTDKRRECTRWFQTVTRVANLIDSAIDLPKDFASGETRVTPSLRNRARLLGAEFWDSTYILGRVNTGILIGLMRLAKDTTEDNSRKYA